MTKTIENYTNKNPRGKTTEKFLLIKIQFETLFKYRHKHGSP